MKKAIFPGSFDPITLGHLDIIQRALTLFDPVIVAVLKNSQKKTLLNIEERINLIKDSLNETLAETERERVEVHSFSGLLVNFAKQIGAEVIIRGLRAVSDYDYETQIALMNKKLYPSIETVFLVTDEKYSYISSTIAKELALFNGDTTQIVPKCVAKVLKEKYQK
ncbi:MAG: pantetheine-phosphate adenylyltransferase [Candidatus Dadabacteria bacterium]|nr:MAG: pantetheine-phosphate adenylyltransferase [Candidatus Dadabacteria bacterium]